MRPPSCEAGSCELVKHKVETEIKLRIDDAGDIKRRLKALGFGRVTARHFESNRLFDFPNFTLGRNGCLLRLRRARGRTILTFKAPTVRSSRPSGRFKVRPEFEAEVNGRRLEQIFAAGGLRQLLRYDKYRTEYRAAAGGRWRGLEAMYDETPVGNFLELEGTERAIDRAARALGFSHSDYITSSYAELYHRWCWNRGIKPGEMVFSKRRA